MSKFNGLLVVDKPPGITSRAVVDRAQAWFPKGTPIGHAGTLDPLATGVLVLCIGSATRLTEYVQDMGKLYRAGVVLGATADTDDADGTITPTPKIEPPMRDEIERELTSFLGNIEQTPPAFSAAKVAGRRAYALARKGKEVSLEPRKVWVHRIDIVSYAYPRLEIIVSCGKGTYIRSLARDLGRQLGCGGYIETLRRLEIGGFKAADAVSLDVDAPTAQARLLPPWRAIQDWPPSSVSMEAAARLRQGRRIKHVHGTYADIALMAVVDNAERMVAIVKPVDGELQPVKVFPES